MSAPRSALARRSARNAERRNAKALASMPAGFVVYRGPSLIDGAPIVVIVNTITSSANAKIGRMAQVWFIRADVAPNVAIKSGRDVAVCGGCPFAGDNGCFVDMRPLMSVWHAFERGSYKDATPEQVGELIALAFNMGKNDGIRLGAYGDPAAAPFEVLEALVGPVKAMGAATTGYTHAWGGYSAPGHVADPRLPSLVMASGHTAADERAARAAGYRSFISQPTPAPIAATAACPASAEAGKRKTCSECGACNGMRSMLDKRASMRIAVHGSAYKVARSIAAIRRVEAQQAAR